MTYGDINSGAVPQPGGIVKAAEVAEGEEPLTAAEQVAQQTQDALNGEGAFANVEAGIKNDVEVAVTEPVVEADDEEASGQTEKDDSAKGGGYVPVTEADDQAASAGNQRVPSADGDEDDDEEEESE